MYELERTLNDIQANADGLAGLYKDHIYGLGDHEDGIMKEIRLLDWIFAREQLIRDELGVKND